MVTALRQRDHLRLAEAPREYPVSKPWILEQIRLGRLAAFKPTPMVTLIRRADLVALPESNPVAQAQPA